LLRFSWYVPFNVKFFSVDVASCGSPVMYLTWSL